MPIYTAADVEAAIARANGQPLAKMRNGSLNGSSPEDLGPSRVIGTSGAKNPYAQSTGHVFAHVATFTQGMTDTTMAGAIADRQFKHKSLWLDRHTAIAAATELMNSRQAQAGLQLFAPPSARHDPVWLQRLTVSGDYYGLEAGSKTPRKVSTGSINFWLSGQTLFIYSCYPDGFVAGAAGLRVDTPDLSALFGPV